MALIIITTNTITIIVTVVGSRKMETVDGRMETVDGRQ